MNARRRPITAKQLAEQTFPYHVNILVPPFVGLGKPLNDMLDWCHKNVGRNCWTYYGHSESPSRGIVLKDYARFYFLEEDVAEVFGRNGGASQTIFPSITRCKMSDTALTCNGCQERLQRPQHRGEKRWIPRVKEK